MVIYDLYVMYGQKMSLPVKNICSISIYTQLIKVTCVPFTSTSLVNLPSLYLRNRVVFITTKIF